MFFSLFLSSNTFLLTASSFTYGKRTKMVFSNIATVDLGRFGRWGFEDQKLAPRSRRAEKPIGERLPPSPSPLRECAPSVQGPPLALLAHPTLKTYTREP